MNYNLEYCDPFSCDEENIWMKLEHCGRYLYACDLLSKEKRKRIIDLACSNGYGSRLLAENGFMVTAADVNEKYLDSEYLVHDNIRKMCFDFDDLFPNCLEKYDAIVCFETIEHLKNPWRFISKLSKYIVDGGVMLISFPNKEYEKINEDGTNRDPYHLHILNIEDVIKCVEDNGFTINNVLGQPICNELCTIQHEWKTAGKLTNEDVDSSFKYTRESILTLSRVMAYPQDFRVDKSYSYLICATHC